MFKESHTNAGCICFFLNKQTQWNWHDTVTLRSNVRRKRDRSKAIGTRKHKVRTNRQFGLVRWVGAWMHSSPQTHTHVLYTSGKNTQSIWPLELYPGNRCYLCSIPLDKDCTRWVLHPVPSIPVTEYWVPLIQFLSMIAVLSSWLECSWALQVQSSTVNKPINNNEWKWGL